MTKPVTHKVSLPKGYHYKLDTNTLIRWLDQNNIKDTEWDFRDYVTVRPYLEFKHADDAIALKLKFGL